MLRLSTNNKNKIIYEYVVINFIQLYFNLKFNFLISINKKFIITTQIT